MSSRTRDLARILGKTEASNTTNAALTVGGETPAIDVFDTLDSLPLLGIIEGQRAFVEENSRLYISNGDGWYNVTLVNQTPTWATEPDASYDIADSATPLIITALAADSDNPYLNLLNQSVASDSAQYMVDISNDSSVFTFTPKSADSIGIEVAAGNLTDSNGDFVYTFKWSDGINFVTKVTTITYNPTGGGGVWYGDRAVYAGNIYGGTGSDIGRFDITTLGNAVGFGGLISNHEDGGHGALSNGTKALFAGGPRSGSRTNDIEVITVSTPATATDFGGTLLSANSILDGIHSGSYGFFSGGETNSGYTDVVQTVVVDTGASAQSFGTLQTGVSQNGNVTDNSRVVRGGNSGGSDFHLQYWSNVSMTTATDFGDWAGGTGIAGTAVGAGDRGIFWGRTYNDYTDIEYISIQTPSNATAFGNLLTNQLNNNGYGEYFSGSANNATRGTKFGGITNGGSNEIQYITMDTLGNGQDFGDLEYRSTYTCGASGAAA